MSKLKVYPFTAHLHTWQPTRLFAKQRRNLCRICVLPEHRLNSLKSSQGTDLSQAMDLHYPVETRPQDRKQAEVRNWGSDKVRSIFILGTALNDCISLT